MFHMGRHHEARAIAKRMLRRAARAIASLPSNDDIRFTTPLHDCFVDLTARSIALTTIPRLPFVRALTLRAPVLLDAQGIDASSPSDRRAALLAVADALDDMRPTDRRPESPALIALRHASDCMHLAPGGRLVVTAPCLTRPGHAILSNGAMPPSSVVDAARECTPCLIVHVDVDARGGVTGRRGSHLLIDLKPVEGVAEIPKDPVAILRTMSRPAGGGPVEVAGIHGEA